MEYSAGEMLIIKEAARLALADADVFDDIAGAMDVADQVLINIREKLQADLNGGKDE